MIQSSSVLHLVRWYGCAYFLPARMRWSPPTWSFIYESPSHISSSLVTEFQHSAGPWTSNILLSLENFQLERLSVYTLQWILVNSIYSYDQSFYSRHHQRCTWYILSAERHRISFTISHAKGYPHLLLDCNCWCISDFAAYSLQYSHPISAAGIRKQDLWNNVVVSHVSSSGICTFSIEAIYGLHYDGMTVFYPLHEIVHIVQSEPRRLLARCIWTIGFESCWIATSVKCVHLNNVPSQDSSNPQNCWRSIFIRIQH
jgi:hypothetical protein